MTCRRPFRMAGVILFCFSSLSFADVVHLKNGRSLEGEIVSETPSEVVLKMGPAQMTVKQSRIQSMTRSTSSEKAEQKAELKKKYFYHEKYSRPELREDAATYRALQNTIRKALKAKGELKEGIERIERLEGEKDRLLHSRANLAEDMLVRQTEEDVEAYNQRIGEHNNIQLRLMAIDSEVQKQMAKIRQNRARIRSAIVQVRAAEAQFSKSRKALGGMVEEQAYFFEQADKLLASGDALQKKIDLVFTPRGDHSIVDVVLNDDVTARMMVDTGASVLTISEDIASQLNLKRNEDVKIPMILADGKTVDMEPITLRSVAVGEALRRNIAAVIVPESEEAELSDVDGLLGMSFLRHFDLNINPANGKIQLVDFVP